MEKIKKSLFITLGCIISAIGFNAFLIPNSIAAGGFSGISILINRFVNIPVGTLIILLNVPLFIIAFFKIGKNFVIISGVCTLLYSVTINLLGKIPVLTNDLVLCAIYGGLCVGVGFGVILKYGATTGGTDMLAKLIGIKYKHFPMGKMMFVMDVCVISASVILIGLEQGLYAVISVFISSKVIDYIIQGVSRSKGFFIITDKPESIANAIMEQLGRGVTSWEAIGRYTDRRKTVLMCAVDNRYEIFMMKEIIKKVDKHAFVLIGDMTEVLGEGFYDFD